MILICFLTITLFMIIFQLVYRRNEAFSQLYQSVPTKCMSCANHLSDDFKWMGNPTKIFSTEQELAGIDNRLGAFGQKTRCFACQRQLADYVNHSSLSPNIDASWKFPGSYVI